MRLPALLTGTALSCLLLAGCNDATAKDLTLDLAARHETGIFDQGAAEIAAYDARQNRVFVVNGSTPSIDIYQLSASGSAASLEVIGTLNLNPNERPTSVAVHGTLAAVAVHDDAPGKPGKVILFSTSGERLKDLPAGALPDMVTFTPDGRHILTANEGEPDDTMDAEGSITLIDLSSGVNGARSTTLGFGAFKAEDLKARGVRIFPGKTAAEDLEPEYITVSPDGKTAWVTLQENNALARVDIENAAITAILPLGTKDHSKPGQGLDPNDKDGVNIAPHPVRGLYMPDSIASFMVNRKTYLVTANEGDARDAEVKLKDAPYDLSALTEADLESLGRLRISAIDGDTDGDGDIDVPHSYGARSFSIWDESGTLVYDSGDAFERITANRLGQAFNSDNDKDNSGDKRSDNKGPEPEGVTVGEIDGRVYAFIGLERVGGIMVYDVTSPDVPMFKTYQLDRTFIGTLDYTLPGDLAKAGDLGPEGLVFVPAEDSPLGAPLLIVANEVSGTVTVYRIRTGP
jgi:DNA-binding beta-propeller fold protein YncE